MSVLSLCKLAVDIHDCVKQLSNSTSIICIALIQWMVFVLHYRSIMSVGVLLAVLNIRCLGWISDTQCDVFQFINRFCDDTSIVKENCVLLSGHCSI